MESKKEQKIDIKKIISILITISIISCIIVLSCYASTTEADNEEFIIKKGYYLINNNSLDDEIEGEGHSGYSYSVSVTYDNINYNGFKLKTNTNKTKIIAITFSLTDRPRDESYVITDPTPGSYIIINNDINSISEESYYAFNKIFTKTESYFIDSNSFIAYSLVSAKTIIDYMITNNIILIVIAIVILSFAIGSLIRIKCNKF